MAHNVNKKQVVVDIISPASAIDNIEFEAIKKFLSNYAIKGNFSYLKNSQKSLVLEQKPSNQFSSFGPKARFRQFEHSVQNCDSDIIWCAKGGYGAIELVDYLAKIKKPKRKKVLIGFSDITILNKVLIEKFGFFVVVAPMLTQIINDEVSVDSNIEIVDFILGKKREIRHKLENLLNNKKTIKGVVSGGCLSVLASQFGTKNQINFNNKILFLEDEGESGERLDRYFSHLLQIMKDKKKYPKAIILGNFFHENIHGNIVRENIEIAISRFVKRVRLLRKNISVYRDMNFVLGHSRNMKPLILGLKSEISDGILIQQL